MNLAAMSLLAASDVTEMGLHEIGQAPADPNSPEALRDELIVELDRRKQLLRLYADMYDGRHPLAFVPPDDRPLVADLLAATCDNWMPLVISAKTERMRIQGFRLGSTIGASSPSEQGDSSLWEIWRRNALDLSFALGLTEAGKDGEAYLLVWPDENGRAEITVEIASEMVVRRSKANRLRVQSALKRWEEHDGTAYATLWTTDRVHRWISDGSTWKRRDHRGDSGEFANPYGIVPVFPIVNRGRLTPAGPPNAALARGVARTAHIGLGRSDLNDVISIQDEINGYVHGLQVAMYTQAYRQRWATGLEVDDDDQGDPQSPYESGADALWSSASVDTKFGEFAASDSANFVRSIDSAIQRLSSKSRVPLHYLNGQTGQIPSGESLKSAETGLVTLARDEQVAAGWAAEQAQRLAAEIDGLKIDDKRIEAIWAPAEIRSESEFVDSLVKKSTIGVPFRQLWEDYGYSPEQMARFSRYLREQAQLALTVQPPGPGDQGTDQVPVDDSNDVPPVEV